MRYSTNRVYFHGVQGFVQQTRLSLDCGHTITYYGGVDIADQMLRENGGKVAGNLSRCKECDDRYQLMVQDIIQQARRQAQL